MCATSCGVPLFPQELQVLDTSLLSATVIAILNIVLPFIFEFLPYFERYRKKNDAIKMTLFR